MRRLLQRALLPPAAALVTLSALTSVAVAAPVAAPAPAATGARTPLAFLTAVTDRGATPAWSRFRLVGMLSPGRAGDRVVVQRRLAGGRWTAFPAATVTRSDGSYVCPVVSGRRGGNDFRVVRYAAGGGPTLVSNITSIVVL
ncbi:MAG: hypothetical protein HYR62_03270 [Actinobacteria bacterium]|nr:hypothetical protein [Actinomycetota bacterium]MBI3687442.1 hypothetical protein [Actinomycetota bacterium]